MPRVRSDGKDLDFKPGENGSLTYKAEVNAPFAKTVFNEPTPEARAKTVPMADDQTPQKVALNIANMMMGKNRTND